MRKQRKWLKYILVGGITLIILAGFVLVGSAFGLHLGSLDLPTVWASNASGAKAAMYRSGYSWQYGFPPGGQTAMGGLAPQAPYDAITLTVEPQEVISFTSCTSSKITGCEGFSFAEAFGGLHYPGEPEYDSIGRDESGKVTFTAPAEPGEYLMRFCFAFKRGSVEFFVNLLVQDDIRN